MVQTRKNIEDVPVIDINISCPAWRRIPDIETLCRTTIQAVLQAEQSPIDCEISLLLTDDLFITTLNQQHRGHKKPTNVLSFPTHNEHTHFFAPCLGDVVVAWETVTREAFEREKPLDDHLRHLIVHGVLHLLGYDHQQEDEAARMEQTECRILARLGVSNPYRIGQPQPIAATKKPSQ